MSKEEALIIIKLLSALESWSFSAKCELPDYLHHNLCESIEKLQEIILDKNK